MKKRLIALLLCTVMLLSALPLGAGAAGEKIMSISITGIPNPIEGGLMPYDSSILKCADPQLYKAYFWNYSWRVCDGYFLPEMLPTFAAGELYTLTLLIVPATGTTGLDDTTAATLPVFIGGQKATYDPGCKPELSEAPGKETFAYTIDMQCAWTNSIKTIDVYGVTPPATGANPCKKDDLSVPADAPYVIADATWVKYMSYPDGEVAQMAEDEKFENGKWYYLNVLLVPKEGYTFAATKDCNWRINGSTELSDEEYSHSNKDTFQLYTADIEAKARHIDTVCLDGMAEILYVGNAAKTAVENVTVPDGAGYTLVVGKPNTNVSKGNSYIADTAVFEAGQSYNVTLRVKPKDGWTIDSSTVWRINGKTALVLGVNKSSEGYWYCRTAAIPATEKTHIDTVRIFGVTDPVAGYTAADCLCTYVLAAPYELIESYWLREEDHYPLKAEDLFEAGKEYSLCCVVKPYEGYAIDNTTTIELNGGDYPVDISGGNADGSYYVWTERLTALEFCTVYWYLDVNDEYPVSGENVLKGEVFGAPDAPDKPGFTFGGWFTDKALTKPYDPTAPILEDTNLYPMWIAVATPCDGGKDCPGKVFNDMPKAGHWAHDAIDWAVVNKVTEGTSPNTFSPGAFCSRGQVVTFLWRAAGRPEPKSANNPFQDVKSTEFYYKAVLWAVEMGITTGTSDNTFSPAANCSRGHIVTFLWRYEGKPEPKSAANPFSDVKSGKFYYTAVLWAVEQGITKGTSDTTFTPDGTCTRAEVVTFLYRDVA